MPVQVSAHAVAAFAEIVRHRRDEAEPPAGLLDPHIAGRAAGPVGDVVEREALEQPRATQRQRQILVGAVAVDLAHRHGLDQRQVHAAAVRPARSVAAISSSLTPFSATALILTLSPAACAASMPVQHLVEIAPAGDRA